MTPFPTAERSSRQDNTTGRGCVAWRDRTLSFEKNKISWNFAWKARASNLIVLVESQIKHEIFNKKIDFNQFLKRNL